MNLVVVVCVAIVLLTASIIGIFFTFYHGLHKPIARSIHVFCCLAMSIISIVMIVSMLKSPREIIKTEYASYNIDKMTISYVIYVDGEEYYTIQFANNLNCVVEKATNEYRNIVVKKSDHKIYHWLIDLNDISTNYTVYLDEESYARYKNNTVIYESKEE